MIPYPKNITIRFGDAKEIFFRVRERVWSGTEWVAGDYRDLTGWTILSQVRATTEDPIPLLEFTATLGDQTDLVNGIGSVYLKLTGAETAGVTRTITTGKWDVELTDDLGDPYTYVAGDVTFTKDVSRV